MADQFTYEAAAHKLQEEAEILRRAARIMRRRSLPNGFWMGVLCRLLTDQAEKMETEAGG